MVRLAAIGIGLIGANALEENDDCDGRLGNPTVVVHPTMDGRNQAIRTNHVPLSIIVLAFFFEFSVLFHYHQLPKMCLFWDCYESGNATHQTDSLLPGHVPT